MSIQLGSIWEALAGEEEPGGREEQRIDGDERRVFKKEALRRGTSFKKLLRGVEEIVQKVKVSVSLSISVL